MNAFIDIDPELDDEVRRGRRGPPARGRTGPPAGRKPQPAMQAPPPAALRRRGAVPGGMARPICHCPAHGDEFVRWVQSTLNRTQGLRLPVDGAMGPATRSALRAYQQQQGLPADGIAGPDTEQALLQGGAAAPLPAADSAPAGPAAEDDSGGAAQELEWLDATDELEHESPWLSQPPGAGAPLNPVPGIEKTSEAFRQKVIRIADGLAVDPNHLMAVMSFESNATFSPSTKNPYRGATGLIQFMPATAVSLGTTVDALARMTPERQLDYVERYFSPRRGRLKTLEDVYMAVLWPKGIGMGSSHVIFRSPDLAYQQNSALDVNRDGMVTVGEATSFVRQRLGSAAPAPAPAAPGSAVNRSSPDYVMWVQRSLNRLLGSGLAVDGISGPMTRSAVRDFQARKRLVVDGIVGPVTEAALVAAGAGQPPGGVVTAPSAPAAPAAPVGSGGSGRALRDRLAAIATAEWEAWQRGRLEENNPAVFERLVQYWMGAGYARSEAENRARLSQGGRDPAGYWSAAFISWCVRQAGATSSQFSFAGAHSTFIAEAYQNRVQRNSKPFKAYSTSEAAPRVGDIIGYARELDVPNTVATVVRDTSGYHTDIVVAIDAAASRITVIGGNLSDSVSAGVRNISTKGYLVHADPKYFGVIAVGD
jgi:peptidoglycan hydrolase-like protein with peptidoglycan-binding domain